jgi:hypothetical protein
LISTGIIVIKSGYLTGDQIRHGLAAFTLATRDSKMDFLPLQYDKVVKALRVREKVKFHIFAKDSQ